MCWETSWVYNPISCQVIYVLLALTHTHKSLYFFSFLNIVCIFVHIVAQALRPSLWESKSLEAASAFWRRTRPFCLYNCGQDRWGLWDGSWTFFPSPFWILLFPGSLFYLIQQICIGPPCVCSAYSNMPWRRQKWMWYRPFAHRLSSRTHFGAWRVGAAWAAMGFPGGTEGKASACNVGHLGSIPGSGRSSGEGNGNPLQYSCLENSRLP